MANLFSPVGYDIEKLHSGIAAYPYDLWNEGERKLLGSFLGHLRSISPGGTTLPCGVGGGPRRSRSSHLTNVSLGNLKGYVWKSIERSPE